MNLAISDYYRILKDAVRYFPASVPVRKCTQLQTFRVLQQDPRRNSEIGTDTLGAIPVDKDSPFFYSRSWELKGSTANRLSYEYPVLTAFEMSNETNGGVFAGSFSRSYFLELAVLDSYQGDKAKDSVQSCGGRSINQIFLDTEYLLDSALRYLGGMVTATTNVDPVEKLYFLPFLEAAKTNGDITSFSVKSYPGATLGGDNQSVRFVRVEYPAKNIFGTKVQIKIKVQGCPTVDFTNEVPQITAIGFEPGCQNC